MDDILLNHEYPDVEFSEEAHYKTAGHDQLQFDFVSIQELKKSLHTRQRGRRRST